MNPTSAPKRYTVTAALPYANGPLHIGHIAGAYLPADVYVRYLRLNRRKVAFICGTDEYGAAITIRAKKEGVSPREIVDKYHDQIHNTFQNFGISFDIFHRTTAPIHTQTAQGVFTKLYEQGEFIEKTTEQFYDETYDQFLADRYIQGTCPVCGFEQAYGDQCEKCGTSLSPEELIDPVSTLSGETPVKRKTKHWYLPLDKYQPWLEQWLSSKEGEWKKNVLGQCLGWLKMGLKPRSMTRDLNWGIDVPLPDAKGKKLYVWLDAPIGYISATKDWAKAAGENWEDYWLERKNPDDNAHLIHFIGKDNIVFHCIIFPSILHAHGGFILPENVPGNEYLNLEGDKLSTSRGWAVWLHEYLEDFPDQQDVLRYVLMANMPETKDSEFTWKGFQERNDNELANILGNLVNRLKLVHKYYDGVVPKPRGLSEDSAAIEVFGQLRELNEYIGNQIEGFRFRDALEGFINIARLGNKYLTDEEPWKRFKTDPDRVARVLYVSLQLVANLAILAKIFLPHTAPKIFQILGIKNEDVFDWKYLGGEALVPAGQQLGSVEPLFPRIPDEKIEAQLEKLRNRAADRTEAATEAATRRVEPAKPETTFDDFTKMDLRVGKIVEASRVPKADKLLQFKVETGLDTRTVVSGVAEDFSPEELLGKQVLLVANLAPRKIRGVVSQGMILFAEDDQGKLYLVNPEREIMRGSVVR